jgi:chromosome segregation and condensation protein ScpB
MAKTRTHIVISSEIARASRRIADSLEILSETILAAGAPGITRDDLRTILAITSGEIERELTRLSCMAG